MRIAFNNKYRVPGLILVALAAAGVGVSANRPGDARVTPESRVQTFISEFYREHQAFMAQGSDMDFDRWNAVVVRLDAAHFIDGGGMALAGSIENPTPHQPGKENLTTTSRRDGRVYVETSVDRSGLTIYFEYEMRDVSGDWRIVRIRQFLDAADAPFMTAKERPRFENPKPHPLRVMPDEDASFDGTALFTAGRRIQSDGKVSAIEVMRIGHLNVSTGVLVVGDLAYGPEVLSPVGLRVPPGKYPAEVAIAMEHILAIRVVLSDRKVVKWHPADLFDGGHGVGVDAANVSISDVSGVLAVNARRKDRLLESFAGSPGRTTAQMLSLANPDDAVICVSGNGDGAYPVFWGVDAQGKPTVLVVAFIDPSAAAH